MEKIKALHYAMDEPKNDRCDDVFLHNFEQLKITHRTNSFSNCCCLSHISASVSTFRTNEYEVKIKFESFKNEKCKKASTFLLLPIWMYCINVGVQRIKLS